MTTLGRDRIRLAIDTSKVTPVEDALTGATPDAWRGKDLQLEIGIFYGSELVDPTNFASITVTVKPSGNRTGDHVFPQKTIASGSINAALLLADWQAGTDQHVIVSWDNSETNVAITGDDDELWVFISALTTDSPARQIPLGHTILKLIETGDGSGSSPAPGDPDYYTADEADARFPRMHRFIINAAAVSSGLISGLTRPLTVNHGKSTIDWTWQVYRVDDNSPVDTTFTPNAIDSGELDCGVVPGESEFYFVGIYL